MQKKQQSIPFALDLSKVYPDPLGKAKGAVISSQPLDVALSADLPAARAFANIPAEIERDVRRDTEEERARHRNP